MIAATAASPEPSDMRTVEAAPETGANTIPTTWGIGSALALVAVAFLLALLAGVVVTSISGSEWGAVGRAIAAGGVLLGLYVALIGIVWGTDESRGVGFAADVGLSRPAGARWYVAAGAASLGAWLFSVGFTGLLLGLGLDLPREDLAVFRLLPGGWLGTALTIALLVIVAPIAEEVVYRGVLLPAVVSRWGMALGLAFSSLLFSAVHLSWVGFVPLAVAGAVFGWLYLRSGSLRVAVVAHALFNALGVIAILVSTSQGAT